MSRRTMLALALVATTGCSLFDGFKSGEELDDIPCASLLEEEEAFALDAMLPLGFTAQQVIDQLIGEQTVTLHWEDGSSEPAQLRTQILSETAIYESETNTPDCPDTADTGSPTTDRRVRLEGSLEIVTTESTRLNESYPLDFKVHSAELITFSKRKYTAEFQGSHELPECQRAELDCSLLIMGSLVPGSSTGEIRIENYVNSNWLPMPQDTAVQFFEWVLLETISWN